MLRPSVVSGSFYSAKPEILSKDIKKFLSGAVIPSRLMDKIKDPFGVVVPHAGYVYSGQTAAYAYKVIAKRPADTYILLGPSHHTFIDGNNLYPSGAFETPLGNVEIDNRLASFMLKQKGMTSSFESHFPEHSLEVQVPFLQSIQKDFKVLPILIGDYSLSNLEQLSSNILEALDHFNKKKIMLIISSDLSHYHSSEVADRIDSKFVDYFKKMMISKMIEELNANRIEACGSGPIITLLLLAKTLNKTGIEILHQSNSAKASHDNTRVVGYFSAIVH